MSNRSKGKHWTHQQGIAHKLSAKYDVPRSKMYVVFKGRMPGIYKTWSECERQVTGYPDARYKSFPDMKSAETALGDFSYSLRAKAEPPKHPKKKTDPMIKARAKLLVENFTVNGKGSHAHTCTSVTCTYPKCLCL